MVSNEVLRRVDAVKPREKHFLHFMRLCGEFYKEDVIISDGYSLDVARREKDGTITELGDLKLGSTIFLDFWSEDIENQQPYFLLSYDQWQRYRKRVAEDNDDYLLYLCHIFTQERCDYLNRRLSDISDRYQPEHFLRKEVSVLKVSMTRLGVFLDNNQCKTVTLNQKIQHQYQSTHATGRIIKIDSRQIGMLTDLTRQWDQLRPEFQKKILGA
jgi:hypothetical protein